MTRFPKDIPPGILSRADELLSAKYGTDRPIDPEIVELVCRGMMGERERAAGKVETFERLAQDRTIGGRSVKEEKQAMLRDLAKAIRGTE